MEKTSNARHLVQIGAIGSLVAAVAALGAQSYKETQAEADADLAAIACDVRSKIEGVEGADEEPLAVHFMDYEFDQIQAAFSEPGCRTAKVNDLQVTRFDSEIVLFADYSTSQMCRAVHDHSDLSFWAKLPCKRDSSWSIHAKRRTYEETCDIAELSARLSSYDCE